MFKQGFLSFLKDKYRIQIALAISILLLVAMILIYLFADFIHTFAIATLAVEIFIILAAWVTNVMIPRNRLRKSVPDKYLKLQSKYPKLKPSEIAEYDYYGTGLAFILMALPTIIFTVIFVII